MNKECKEFLRKIKCAFPVFNKDEKRFYIDFSLALKEYVNRHPNCTQKDLVKYFGTPKDIVIMYYDNMYFSVYDAILKQKQHVRQIFIRHIIVNVILFIIGIFCFMSGRKFNAKDMYSLFKYRK